MTSSAPGRPAPTSDCLLISRIGRDSLHLQWIHPEGERSFDVLLSSYAADVPLPGEPGLLAEYRPGSKVAGYAGILRDYRDLIAGYRYIALFDDDLSADSRRISDIFAVCRQHDFRIAQPALTHDSHFTYAALLQNSAFELRHVNFIEMMCPVFRVDVLLDAAFLFDLGFESGIDLIWCNLGAAAPHDFAVIDACPVRHTRPVGTNKASNGFTGGRRYEDDIHAILGQFGLRWLACLPYGGITRTGRYTTSRVAFLASARRLVPAIVKQRPYLSRARSVARHWRQLVHRRPINTPVPRPEV